MYGSSCPFLQYLFNIIILKKFPPKIALHKILHPRQNPIRKLLHNFPHITCLGANYITGNCNVSSIILIITVNSKLIKIYSHNMCIVGVIISNIVDHLIIIVRMLFIPFHVKFNHTGTHICVI